MSKKTKNRELHLGLLLLPLLLALPKALAAPRGPEDRQREIRQEQADLQNRQHGLENQRKSRTQELRDLDRKIDRHRQDLKAQEKELKGLRGREQDLTLESRELDGQLSLFRKQLATRLRSLYELGLLRPILFVMESSSPAELYGRITFLDRMASAEKALIRKSQRTLDRKVASQKELQLRESDIERNQIRRKKLQADLGETRRRKASMLSEVMRDLRDVATLIAEHAEADRRLGLLIEEAERQKKVQLQAEAGAFLALRQGKLEWPVAGTVIRGFGRQKLAANAYLKSDGLEIEAPYGTPVKAVAAGTVLYADWHEGQGKTIILRHGGSDASIYLHLDSLAVTTGESVSEGQVLGAVGDTGTMSGKAALGFQIRHSATPQDPILYLRKK